MLIKIGYPNLFTLVIPFVLAWWIINEFEKLTSKIIDILIYLVFSVLLKAILKVLKDHEEMTGFVWILNPVYCLFVCKTT